MYIPEVNQKKCNACDNKQCGCASKDSANQMREMMHTDIGMHELFAGF